VDISPSLPSILEVKRTLAGAEKRFQCRLLAADGGHVAVLWVADEAMHVHGVDLPAGTVSFGHFWTDRPYNVYHWVDPGSRRTLGFYFNISDGTRVGPGLLEWRDLVVDVLALPGAPGRVLDEDELPADLPGELRARIEAEAVALLRDLPAVTAEVEAASRALHPLVFGAT
jgi:hypothetical protein